MGCEGQIREGIEGYCKDLAFPEWNRRCLYCQQYAQSHTLSSSVLFVDCTHRELASQLVLTVTTKTVTEGLTFDRCLMKMQDHMFSVDIKHKEEKNRWKKGEENGLAGMVMGMFVVLIHWYKDKYVTPGSGMGGFFQHRTTLVLLSESLWFYS